MNPQIFIYEFITDLNFFMKKKNESCDFFRIRLNFLNIINYKSKYTISYKTKNSTNNF